MNKILSILFINLILLSGCITIIDDEDIDDSIVEKTKNSPKNEDIKLSDFVDFEKPFGNKDYKNKIETIVEMDEQELQSVDLNIEYDVDSNVSSLKGEVNSEKFEAYTFFETQTMNFKYNSDSVKSIPYDNAYYKVTIIDTESLGFLDISSAVVKSTSGSHIFNYSFNIYESDDLKNFLPLKINVVEDILEVINSGGSLEKFEVRYKIEVSDDAISVFEISFESIVKSGESVTNIYGKSTIDTRKDIEIIVPEDFK